MQKQIPDPYFQPVNITDFSGGLQTKYDAEELKDNESPDIINGVFVAKGALTRRRGYRVLGTEADSGVPKTLYKLAQSDGNEYLLKAIGTKIKVLESGVWEDSETDLADGLRWGFVTYEDRVYGGNGTDDDMYSDDPTSGWTTTAGNPKSNIQLIYGGRRLVAVNQTLYYTKTTDQNDFTTVGGGATNDGGYTTFPTQILALHGFVDYNNEDVVIVYGANNQTYILSIDDSNTTIGTIAAFKSLKSGMTSIKHFATVTVDNDIYGIDDFNQIRSLGYRELLPNIQTDVVSEAISETMDTVDLTDPVATLFDREYVLSLRSNDTMTLNDIQLIYNPFYKSWTKYLGAGANDYAIWDGKLTFASSFNKHIYYFDPDVLDDDDGTAIYFRYSTKWFNFGIPLRLKQFKRLRIGGKISETCNLKVKVYFDYATAPAFTWTIAGNKPAILDGELSDSSFGSTAGGGGAFGGGLPADSFRAFHTDLEASSLTDFDVMRVQIENEEAGTDFIINKIKLFVTAQDEDYYPQDRIIRPD